MFIQYYIIIIKQKNLEVKKLKQFTKLILHNITFITLIPLENKNKFNQISILGKTLKRIREKSEKFAKRSKRSGQEVNVILCYSTRVNKQIKFW